MKEWQSDERKFPRFLPNMPHSKTRRNLPPIGCYFLRGSNQLTPIHAQLTGLSLVEHSNLLVGGFSLSCCEVCLGGIWEFFFHHSAIPSLSILLVLFSSIMVLYSCTPVLVSAIADTSLVEMLSLPSCGTLWEELGVSL